MPSRTNALINRDPPSDPEAQTPPAEATPQQPKPEATPPKTKKPTKVQLEGLHAFLQDDFPHHKFVAPDDEPEKPKEADKSEDEEKEGGPPPESKKGETPPAKAKKPAPKPKPRVEPPAPLTTEQIAEAAARGVAKGMAETKPAEEKPKKPKLDPEEEAKVEVLKHMESLHPDKYKGLSDKYLEGMKAIDAYAKKWESEHPGQEFDETAPEHADIFREHDVDYTDRDYNAAQVDLYSQPLVERATADAKKRIDELERKVKVQESQREIAGQQVKAASSFWSKLGDEFKDVIMPNGQSNDTKLTELAKTDPHVATRIRVAQVLDTEVAEAYKLFNQLTDYDEKNRVHVELSKFMLQKEKELMGLPYEDRVDSEGRQFLPAAEYAKLSKASKDTHWTFTLDNMVEMRTGHLAKIVKENIETEEAAHRAWAKARGIQLPEPGKPTAEAAAAEGGETRELTPMEEAERNRRSNEKPQSPSFMADTRGGATRGANPPGARPNSPLDVRNVL